MPKQVAEQLVSPPPTGRESLRQRYLSVRRFTERLCAPLETEDFVIQSMPDASPTRWHIAHTTWFFETFLLARAMPAYRPFHPQFAYLFNSYYNAVGRQHPRPQRGLLSRPTVSEIRQYRAGVDRQVTALLDNAAQLAEELRPIVEIGLQHEQQHQELMLTDIKHAFSCNPLLPTYRPADAAPDEAAAAPATLEWVGFDEGLRWIGCAGPGFSFDNEQPRHRVFVPAFELASRPLTSAEFLEFIADGGYARPELWLSDGWATVQQQGWCAPLYWRQSDGRWEQFTLSGLRPVDPHEPLCHVSFFEADAYARWAGARLPTEAEWEVAAEHAALAGNFVESERFHPAAAPRGQTPGRPLQLFGDVWEWTASQYLPYPGFCAPAGALGEYNGKFMCNQFVLRGGSCATPGSHIRRTYRNFFPPAARWQFSGLRLAR